jgi:hypothetical protein
VNVTGELFGVIAPKVLMKSEELLGPTNPLIGVNTHPGAAKDMLVMPGLMQATKTTNASFALTGV